MTHQKKKITPWNGEAIFYHHEKRTGGGQSGGAQGKF